MSLQRYRSWTPHRERDREQITSHNLQGSNSGFGITVHSSKARNVEEGGSKPTYAPFRV